MGSGREHAPAEDRRGSARLGARGRHRRGRSSSPFDARDRDLITSNSGCGRSTCRSAGPTVSLLLWQIARDGPLPADLVLDGKVWETWRTGDVARRRTDKFLYRHPAIRTRPLPAFLRPAWRDRRNVVTHRAPLAREGVTVDRSGMTGLVCETYPRAVQAAWGHRDFARPAFGGVDTALGALYCAAAADWRVTGRSCGGAAGAGPGGRGGAGRGRRVR